MTDFFRTLLGIFASVAPFGALPVFLAFARFRDDGQRSLRDAAWACGIAGGVLALAALVADPVLDFLDISSENFQLAAAVAMLPLAVRLMLTADSARPPDEPSGPLPAWLVPLAVPLLASPPAIIAVMSYSARYGEGEAIAAVAIVMVLTAAVTARGSWIEQRVGRFGLGALGRLSGALLVVVAVELAVDGIRSV